MYCPRLGEGPSRAKGTARSARAGHDRSSRLRRELPRPMLERRLHSGRTRSLPVWPGHGGGRTRNCCRDRQRSPSRATRAYPGRLGERITLFHLLFVLLSSACRGGLNGRRSSATGHVFQKNLPFRDVSLRPCLLLSGWTFFAGVGHIYENIPYHIHCSSGRRWFDDVMREQEGIDDDNRHDNQLNRDDYEEGYGREENDDHDQEGERFRCVSITFACWLEWNCAGATSPGRKSSSEFVRWLLQSIS